MSDGPWLSGKRNFYSMLKKHWDEGKFVCVGLDSDLNRIPWHIRKAGSVETTLLNFNIAIVDATSDLVCAYKPNLAFYIMHGSAGLNALAYTVDYIQKKHRDIPIILDAKIADIANTNRFYAKFVFDKLGADAVTVNPYLGRDALQPFIEHKDKGIFVLCKTSNPGAGELQDRTTMLRYDETDSAPASVDLYNLVARRVSKNWNTYGNCGLVAGATHPQDIFLIRRSAGDIPLLIPGIGRQVGNLEASIKAGINSKGQGIIINSSSGIIFSSSGKQFAETARSSLHGLRNRVEACVESYSAKRP